jgi:hypothetical protein
MSLEPIALRDCTLYEGCRQETIVRVLVPHNKEHNPKYLSPDFADDGL